MSDAGIVQILEDVLAWQLLQAIDQSRDDGIVDDDLALDTAFATETQAHVLARNFDVSIPQSA